MTEPIVYIDVSEIRDGKLEDLRIAMKELAAFVEANEPQLSSYGFFLDEERSRMTVVAVHPDSDSIEFHMDIGGPEFCKFTELSRLQRIEIYGRITEGALERLHQRTELLGSGTVTVHELHSGFTRIPPLPSPG